MFLNQVSYVLWNSESSIEHKSSKDTCNFAFIIAFAFILCRFRKGTWSWEKGHGAREKGHGRVAMLKLARENTRIKQVRIQRGGGGGTGGPDPPLENHK